MMWTFEHHKYYSSEHMNKADKARIARETREEMRQPETFKRGRRAHTN